MKQKTSPLRTQSGACQAGSIALITNIIQAESDPHLLEISGRIPGFQARSHMGTFLTVARCFDKFVHAMIASVLQGLCSPLSGHFGA